MNGVVGLGALARLKTQGQRREGGRSALNQPAQASADGHGAEEPRGVIPKTGDGVCGAHKVRPERACAGLRRTNVNASDPGQPNYSAKSYR